MRLRLPCSKGFRHMKLCVPRFGCGYFGELKPGRRWIWEALIRLDVGAPMVFVSGDIQYVKWRKFDQIHVSLQLFVFPRTRTGRVSEFCLLGATPLKENGGGVSKTDGFLRFFAFPSSPLRRSGLRVSKIEGKLRFFACPKLPYETFCFIRLSLKCLKRAKIVKN